MRQISRRALGAAALMLTASLSLTACAPALLEPTDTPVRKEQEAQQRTDRAFQKLEREYDAELGVYAIDTGSGRLVGYQSGKRFGFASTIKALSAAAAIDKAGIEELGTLIRVPEDGLVAYSPVSEKRAGGVMTLREVAAAAVQHSDNTAGNLLMEYLGGPSGFASALQKMGDTTTRVSRTEPTLNDIVPGDERDTSTARALVETLSAYAFSDAVDPESEAEQRVLLGLLKGSVTGDSLIRAGAPEGWVVGDKSGAAAYGTRNDLGVVWPSGGKAPIVIAVLSQKKERDAKYDDALVASAAKVALEELERDAKQR